MPEALPLLEVATAVGMAPDPVSGIWTANKVWRDVYAEVTTVVVAVPEKESTSCPDLEKEQAAEAPPPLSVAVASEHSPEAVIEAVMPFITVLMAPTSCAFVASAIMVPAMTLD